MVLIENKVMVIRTLMIYLWKNVALNSGHLMPFYQSSGSDYMIWRLQGWWWKQSLMGSCETTVSLVTSQLHSFFLLKRYLWICEKLGFTTKVATMMSPSNDWWLNHWGVSWPMAILTIWKNALNECVHPESLIIDQNLGFHRYDISPMWKNQMSKIWDGWSEKYLSGVSANPNECVTMSNLGVCVCAQPAPMQDGRPAR